MMARMSHPTILGTLLEGFAPDAGPQVLDGRLRSGDRVSVPVKGSDRIVGRVMRASDSKPATHVLVAPEGGGPHVEASVKSARHDTPEQHGQEREKRRAELEAQGPPMVPAKGGQQPAKPERGKAVKPGPMRESFLGELLEGFDDARHPRDFHGRFIHVGSKVRVMSGGQEGALTHTVESIDGSSVTVRAPAKPSLGGGATRVVPASSLSVHGSGSSSPLAVAPDIPAPADNHGGFKVGDQVRYKQNYGVGMESGKVARLSRNGNLTVRHPNGTTVDVHHSNARFDTLHPDHRGEQAQRAIALGKAQLAREKAARAARPVGHDPRGPINPAHVDPSRHPTPTAGPPPDAAGLMKARERAAAEPVARAALAKGQRPVGGASIMAAAGKAQASRAEILAKSPNAQRELEAYRSAGPGTPEVTASTPNVKAYITGKIDAGSLSNQERAFTLTALKHDAPHVERMAKGGTVAQAAYDRILRQIKELERLSRVQESAPAGMLVALLEAHL